MPTRTAATAAPTPVEPPAPTTPPPITTVLVWENNHNGIGRVTQANEDGTLDLEVEGLLLGRTIHLTGVHARVGGGNGWERIPDALKAEPA